MFCGPPPSYRASQRNWPPPPPPPPPSRRCRRALVFLPPPCLRVHLQVPLLTPAHCARSLAPRPAPLRAMAPKSGAAPGRITAAPTAQPVSEPRPDGHQGGCLAYVGPSGGGGIRSGDREMAGYALSCRCHCRRALESEALWSCRRGVAGVELPASWSWRDAGTGRMGIMELPVPDPGDRGPCV